MAAERNNLPAPSRTVDAEITRAEQAASLDLLAEKQHINYERIDDEVAQYASAGGLPITEEDDVRLRRLIDRRVLVVMVVTYFLQAVDKGTMSFTSIMGIFDETALTQAQFPWLTTCIYIAVLVVEYPELQIIQRVPIAKWLAINIFLWSVVLACHAVAYSFASWVALRTLLGVFEAACQPTFLVLSSMWYRRHEQIAVVVWWYAMNGLQQVVSGLLAYCFSLIQPGAMLHSWQALFVTYGCVSAVWAVFVAWWMPDSPMRAKCFSEEDKVKMVERVRENQTGLQNRTFRKEQVREALTDPQTWCYCAIAITTTLPTSGLGAFANIVIKSFGFSTLQTQLLAMVLGFYIIVVLFLSKWLVEKTNQSLWVMLGFVAPSFVGTILLMTLSPTTFSLRVGMLICYYITLSFWSAQTLAMSMISRNIAGQTKKSTVVAANFIAWAAGNAAGPQVFLSWDAPRYFVAFATHLGCYSVLVLSILVLRWWLLRENRKRDKLRDEGAREAEEVVGKVHAFEDLTDRENLSFRYIV